MLPPGLPAAARELDPKLTHGEEDLVTYCLFPEVALGYFKWRALPEDQRPPSPADAEESAAQAKRAPTAAQEGAAAGVDAATAHFAALGRGLIGLFRQMGASLPEGTVLPETPVTPPPPPPAPAPAESAAAPAQPAGETINAPLNGTFYRTPGPGKPNFADEGAALKSGDAVCVVEAMKLFNQIKAPKACKVVKFLVEHGSHVSKGQPLAVIAAL
jgi:biotin carboxyl carrier protein